MRILVHLTRAQVHQLFPRLRDRFPLSVELPALGTQPARVLDLAERLEVWPVTLNGHADA